MKWAEMTPEQKNTLVAEKVMRWKSGPCDGEIGEQSNSSDGWFCLKCGHDGSWGDDQEHEEMPRRYSESIAWAWDIVEKMVSRMGYQDPTFKWLGPLFKPENEYLSAGIALPVEGYPLGTTCWYVRLELNGIIYTVCAEKPQEAICMAALKACTE